MKRISKLLCIGIILCCMGVVYNSCEEETFEQETSVQQNENQEYELVEVELHGKTVIAQKIGKEYLLDDIILDLEQGDNNKLTGKITNFWPDNIVYYNIEPDVISPSRISYAIAHWEARTALTFVERTTESSYITFRTGTVCSSNVGRIGGQQYINLTPGCFEGKVIHEIGHAIGLWHEQSRIDRDDYIIFHEENANPDGISSFLTYEEKGRTGAEYTSELDFNSVMLYDSYAFSINGKPTLTKLNGDTWEKQRDGLSIHDVLGIDKMYPPATPKKINIQSIAYKYVSSENGQKPMICNRDTPRSWEAFELIELSNGNVALKGNNGKYVSSENGLKPITCNRKEIREWEEFELIMYSQNRFSLRSVYNNKYISAQSGTEPMTCDQSSVGSWEVFIMSNAD